MYSVKKIFVREAKINNFYFFASYSKKMILIKNSTSNKDLSNHLVTVSSIAPVKACPK